MVEWTFSLDGELAGFCVGTSCNQSLARLIVIVIVVMMMMMMMMIITIII
jgi:hypothetical protein